jgi:hypothetical protein
MLEDQEEYSILQRKFREWFGKTVPVAKPLPDEADHSIGDPVPIDLPLRAKADRLNDRTRIRHVDNAQEFFELLGFGFRGAVSYGAVVGLIIVFLDLSFLGWDSDNWPIQLFVIFFATLLGLFIGVSKGYISQLREKYFYKGDL